MPDEVGPGREPERGPSAADPGRRQFFRSFSRDAIQAAAQVVGVATALQRATGAAAGELLGMTAQPNDPPFEGGAPIPSPYRLEGQSLLVLDQRRYPHAVVELACRTAPEVVALLEQRRVQGSLTAAQVAAYGTWLAALAARDLTPFARRAVIRGHARAIAAACPNVAPVGWAIGQALAAESAAFDADRDGPGTALAIRQAADAVAARLTRDVARMVRLAAESLAQPTGRPLGLLLLDSTGSLAAPSPGTALGVAVTIARQGRAVRAWVLETRPYLSGARLAARELASAGVSATVLLDSAAAWHLAREPVDAVLVGADRIAADGATTAVIGTVGLALLARDAGVPFWVVAPLAAVDPSVTGAASSSVAEGSYAAVGPDLPTAADGDALAAVQGPLQDVTPPELVDAIVAEVGVLRPEYGPSLAAALAVPPAGALEADRPG